MGRCFYRTVELVVVFKPHCKRKIRIRVEDLTLVTHEAVIELILRLAVVTKYNSGSHEFVVSLTDIRHICQNLTSREVRLTSIKGCFCRNNIVVASQQPWSKVLRHGACPQGRPVPDGEYPVQSPNFLRDCFLLEKS